MVATPDRDVHYEELSLLNADLKGIRVKPSPHILPNGINAADVYPLPVFTAAELGGLRVEAQRALREEKLARGLIEGGCAGPGDQGSQWKPGTLYWIAAETVGDIRYGNAVGGVPDALVRDSRARHTLSDGQTIFVQCIDGGTASSFCNVPPSTTTALLLRTKMPSASQTAL